MAFSPANRDAAGGGGGGGVVQQGARDATVQDWLVDVLSLPSLPAGLNNIGDVDVLTLPAVVQGTSPWVVGDGGGSLTIDSTQLPAALVGGRLDVNVGASANVGVTQVTTPWKAREDTAAMAWVSGKVAAPAIGAVIADTGQLAAGDYDFDVLMVVSDTVVVGKGLVIEHRNAANGVTLQNLGGVSTQGELEVRIRRYTMALSERVRVIAGTAAGAAASMYVAAIGRRTS